MATSSTTPTSARPPARRATPGGNRSTGRNRRCSRHVSGSATTTSAAIPSVVPTDRTSSAVRESGPALGPCPTARRPGSRQLAPGWRSPDRWTARRTAGRTAAARTAPPKARISRAWGANTRSMSPVTPTSHVVPHRIGTIFPGNRPAPSGGSLFRRLRSGTGAAPGPAWNLPPGTQHGAHQHAARVWYGSRPPIKPAEERITERKQRWPAVVLGGVEEHHSTLAGIALPGRPHPFVDESGHAVRSCRDQVAAAGSPLSCRPARRTG